MKRIYLLSHTYVFISFDHLLYRGVKYREYCKRNNIKNTHAKVIQVIVPITLFPQSSNVIIACSAAGGCSNSSAKTASKMLETVFTRTQLVYGKDHVVDIINKTEQYSRVGLTSNRIV